MTENRTSKMNLEQERKIAELQERVNRLENLCYAAKEVLNLEEAANFLGIAKSTLYKMTHLNQLPYFKPAGKLIFFEKQKLIDWVRGAKSKSIDEIKEEAAAYFAGSMTAEQAAQNIQSRANIYLQEHRRA